jgi:hypothetical protein
LRVLQFFQLISCYFSNLFNAGGKILREEVSPYTNNDPDGSDADVLQIEAAPGGSLKKRNGAAVDIPRPSKRQKRHKEDVELLPFSADIENKAPTNRDNEMCPGFSNKDRESEGSMSQEGSMSPG